jgi:peptidoglycan/LPS O-acetylase OafA/YrhL
VHAARATASFVTWLALDIRRGGGTSRAAARTRSLLESRPLFTLGLFSYSLYLTHGLVLVAVVRATEFLGHAPTLRACVVMVAAVLISLALAYVFYRVVERRCMSAETRAMFTPAEADRPRIPAHPARRAAAASARPHDADRGSRP